MKFKRYEGGGEISGTVDPKEAADKEAGLKASKGDDVGFLQRLRMGNIDDPSSEAYKRFGAGRGRSKAAEEAPTKVEETKPIPRPLAYPNPIFEEGKKQGMRQSSGDASVAEEYANRPRNPEAIMEADNPRKTAPKPNAPKPNASKPSKAAPKLIDPSNIKSERLEFEESQIAPKLIDPSNIRSGRQEFEESQIAPVDVTKLSLAERQKLKNQRAKSIDVTKLSLAERMKMKSGGSVSSASRRADGIATKGKTRGRMC